MSLRGHPEEVDEAIPLRETDHYSINASGLVNGIYRIAIYAGTGRPIARASFVKK